MATGEQITFEPALQRMFTQHLHHVPVQGKFGAIGIFGEVVGEPNLLGCFIDRTQLIGSGFIGSEDAEVVRVLTQRVA